MKKTYPDDNNSKEKFPSMKVVRSTKWINHKKNDYFGPYTYGAFYLKNILSKVLRLETVIEICLRYTIDPALDITLKIVMDPVSTKMLTRNIMKV